MAACRSSPSARWPDVRGTRVIQAGFRESNQPSIYRSKVEQPAMQFVTERYAGEIDEFNAVVAFATYCQSRVIGRPTPSASAAVGHDDQAEGENNKVGGPGRERG